MLNIADNQSSAEVPMNENFRNVLWAELFARNPETTGVSTALTWGYVGGQFPINGVITNIPNGTIALTASTTNYVGLTMAGAVVNSAGSPNPSHIPLYTIVTTTTISSYVDTRSAALLNTVSFSNTSIAVTGANVTLTQAQALCKTMKVTGTVTGSIRDLIVPLVRRRWYVQHNGTGFPVRVIGASGTGTTIEIGQKVLVECDGVNVYSLLNSSLVLGDSIATTSGTTVSLSTAIPAGTRKVTINFNGVSTTGIVPPYIQIGPTGGLEVTGYTGSYANISGAVTESGSYSSGFIVGGNSASDTRNGTITLNLVSTTGALSTWAISGTLSNGGGSISLCAGIKNITGTLSRLSLTTTDAFDAGSISLSYE